MQRGGGTRSVFARVSPVVFRPAGTVRTTGTLANADPHPFARRRRFFWDHSVVEPGFPFPFLAERLHPGSHSFSPSCCSYNSLLANWYNHGDTTVIIFSCQQQQQEEEEEEEEEEKQEQEALLLLVAKNDNRDDSSLVVSTARI